MVHLFPFIFIYVHFSLVNGREKWKSLQFTLHLSPKVNASQQYNNCGMLGENSIIDIISKFIIQFITQSERIIGCGWLGKNSIKKVKKIILNFNFRAKVSGFSIARLYLRNKLHLLQKLNALQWLGGQGSTRFLQFKFDFYNSNLILSRECSEYKFSLVHPLGIPGWWEGIGRDTFELFYFIAGVIIRGTSGPFHRSYLFPQNAGGGGRGSIYYQVVNGCQ